VADGLIKTCLIIHRREEKEKGEKRVSKNERKGRGKKSQPLHLLLLLLPPLSPNSGKRTGNTHL